MKKTNVAIDGPAGAGKSTVAKDVAHKLGYIYIDTGAMYRALTLKALNLNLDLNDEQKLAEYLNSHSIRFINKDNSQRITVDDIDVTELIRTPEVTKNASLVASHKKVRECMVKIQRKLAKNANVVMDGRDIGTNVLPNADLKIFLTASIDVRARRRYEELLSSGYKADFEQIKAEIAERDKRDQERKHNPLRKAEDAILIDTSELTIEEVVNLILEYANRTCEGEK